MQQIPRMDAPSQKHATLVTPQIPALQAQGQLLPSVHVDDPLYQMLQSLETPQLNVCRRYDK